jgi:hypothetical protein
MNLVAGRAMRSNGYRPVPARPGVVATAVSIALAPLSVAATAVRVPSMVPGSFVSYVLGWRKRWNARA